MLLSTVVKVFNPILKKCRKNVSSNRNLFVAMSLLLMIGYVGYLFAGVRIHRFPPPLATLTTDSRVYGDFQKMLKILRLSFDTDLLTQVFFLVPT